MYTGNKGESSALMDLFILMNTEFWVDKIGLMRV